MTTTPARHRPFRSLLALAICALAPDALASASAASPQGETGQRDWEFVDLPALDERVPAGFRAHLDGLHIDVDESDGELTRLGEWLAPRAVELLVRSALDDRGLDATLESLDGRLIVRGDRAARDLVREVVQDLDRDLDGLRAPLHVKLTGTGRDGDEIVVFDEHKEAISGARLAFGKRRTAMFLTDYDVEVATSKAVADPIVTKTAAGETLHLWTSTSLGPDGKRRVFVQGLLDLAVLRKLRTFDTELYEFGTIEQPAVNCVQVIFAGYVPRSGALRVALSGLPGDLATRTLEIRHEATEFESPAPRIVDFSRGLWRTSLVAPHALHGEIEDFPVAQAATPSAAMQLSNALFGSDREARPVFGESLVVLPVNAPDGYARMQSFATDLDPIGPPTTLLFQRGKLRAEVPMHSAMLVRVAVTREDLITSEYDPQIANEAALADPNSERVLSGIVFEGVARGATLHGRCTVSEILSFRERAADAVDMGRLQMLDQVGTSIPIRVKSGKSVQPLAATAITWSPTAPAMPVQGSGR